MNKKSKNEINIKQIEKDLRSKNEKEYKNNIEKEIEKR